MRLKDISISNPRRRKAKVFFLILGLTIGITTVVTPRFQLFAIPVQSRIL